MNIGARLRTGREARGLSIAAVAVVLRVPPRFLTAIEENDCRAIPPRPYGRGFVRAYAAHLGENPDETVREFFAQFAPPAAPVQTAEAPRRAPRSGEAVLLRLRGGVAAGVLTCMVVAVLVLAAIRTRPTRDASTPNAVGTAGTSAPAAAGTAGLAHTQGRTEQSNAPVSIELEATGPAWVTATVDGRRAIYRTMQAGEHETLRGRESISVRVGDAGAIRWQVNGRSAAVMGPSGAVKSARITAQ